MLGFPKKPLKQVAPDLQFPTRDAQGNLIPLDTPLAYQPKGNQAGVPAQPAPNALGGQMGGATYDDGVLTGSKQSGVTPRPMPRQNLRPFTPPAPSKRPAGGGAAAGAAGQANQQAQQTQQFATQLLQKMATDPAFNLGQIAAERALNAQTQKQMGTAVEGVTHTLNARGMDDSTLVAPTIATVVGGLQAQADQSRADIIAQSEQKRLQALGLLPQFMPDQAAAQAQIGQAEARAQQQAQFEREQAMQQQYQQGQQALQSRGLDQQAAAQQDENAYRATQLNENARQFDLSRGDQREQFVAQQYVPESLAAKVWSQLYPNEAYNGQPVSFWEVEKFYEKNPQLYDAETQAKMATAKYQTLAANTMTQPVGRFFTDHEALRRMGINPDMPLGAVKGGFQEVVLEILKEDAGIANVKADTEQKQASTKLTKSQTVALDLDNEWNSDPLIKELKLESTVLGVEGQRAGNIAKLIENDIKQRTADDVVAQSRQQTVIGGQTIAGNNQTLAHNAQMNPLQVRAKELENRLAAAKATVDEATAANIDTAIALLNAGSEAQTALTWAQADHFVAQTKKLAAEVDAGAANPDMLKAHLEVIKIYQANLNQRRVLLRQYVSTGKDKNGNEVKGIKIPGTALVWLGPPEQLQEYLNLSYQYQNLGKELIGLRGQQDVSGTTYTYGGRTTK